MKTDQILEEVWRVKDKLSGEMAADPDAYFAKLAEITKAEENAGRKIIRSAGELRQMVAEKERQRVLAMPMTPNTRILTVFARDADYSVLEAEFKKAGIDSNRRKLTTLSVAGGDQTVLWVTISTAAFNAAAAIFIALARRNKKLVIKCGDREIQAENYSNEELAEILPKAQEIYLKDAPMVSHAR